MKHLNLLLGAFLVFALAPCTAVAQSGTSDIYYDPESDIVYAEAHSYVDLPDCEVYAPAVDLTVYAPDGNVFDSGSDGPPFFDCYGDAYIEVYPDELGNGYGDYESEAMYGVDINGYDTAGVHGASFQYGYPDVQLFLPEPDPYELPPYVDTVYWYGCGMDSTNAPSPAVSITVRSSGTISSDNSASNAYISVTGTSNLGITTASQPDFKACFAGLEFVGTVSPSTYPSLLQLHRTVLSCGIYINSSTAVNCGSTLGDDTSGLANRDDDPQSGGSGGKIYDWDATGVQNGTSANSIYRFRANFREYATLADGKTVVSANPIDYFVRISCAFDGSGNAALAVGIPDDNQVGIGTTRTTWNLQ